VKAARLRRPRSTAVGGPQDEAAVAPSKPGIFPNAGDATQPVSCSARLVRDAIGKAVPAYPTGFAREGSEESFVRPLSTMGAVGDLENGGGPHTPLGSAALLRAGAAGPPRRRECQTYVAASIRVVFRRPEQRVELRRPAADVLRGAEAALPAPQGPARRRAVALDASRSW
jgi:hypothetical protein